MKLRVLFAGLALALVCMAAESGAALYQKAVTQERAGKLDEAIKLYEEVAHDFASDHPLAAKALMSAARCIETLGRDNASKLYEQVTREYGDQRQLAQAARSKLAALRQPAPQTMTLRKIETGDLDIIATDGQRAIYQDDSGTVFYGDLGGRNKQVVFKPKPEDLPGLRVFASRDMSMVLLSFSKQNGQQVYAVVNADGTGYREIARRSGPGTPASWSWDNRFVLLSEFASDAVGKPVSRLLSLSLADGRTSEFLHQQLRQPSVAPATSGHA